MSFCVLDAWNFGDRRGWILVCTRLCAVPDVWAQRQDHAGAPAPDEVCLAAGSWNIVTARKGEAQSTAHAWKRKCDFLWSCDLVIVRYEGFIEYRLKGHGQVCVGLDGSVTIEGEGGTRRLESTSDLGNAKATVLAPSLATSMLGL